MAFYNGWSYTTYSGNLQNFSAGVSKLRAIISNGSSCPDTSNYVNVQINGPLAGLK
jgi:hypothetical protein